MASSIPKVLVCCFLELVDVKFERCMKNFSNHASLTDLLYRIYDISIPPLFFYLNIHVGSNWMEK